MKPLSERIEIEKAFLEGKEVEFRQYETWYRLEPRYGKDEYVFRWDDLDYRIKPEPRVIYVNEYDQGVLGGCLFLSEDEAKESAHDGGYMRTIRFIEDLEGD